MTRNKRLIRRDKVPERLGHFLAVNGEEAVVDPVSREGPAGRPRLGDLILVVREDEVHPAAVDVEGIAEVLRAHRGAFDVPARAARPPRAAP